MQNYILGLEWSNVLSDPTSNCWFLARNPIEVYPVFLPKMINALIHIVAKTLRCEVIERTVQIFFSRTQVHSSEKQICTKE